MKYAFYPGCSSENLTRGYEASLRAVAAVLGLELEPIPDWNCCGAMQYPAVSRLAAYALAARNLALVPDRCSEVIACCSACMVNLQRVEAVMSEHADFRDKINLALEAGRLSYTPGRLAVRHILDVLVSDIGLEHIRERVTRPLVHLRVAPYYGCLLIRPMCRLDDPEYPTTMDRLFAALGLAVTSFSLRGYCCGGHLPQINEQTGLELIHRILKNASEAGANVIAVACPVCQLNLELYQQDIKKKFRSNYNMPVLFFSQVMGLAFGLPKAVLGIDTELPQ